MKISTVHQEILDLLSWRSGLFIMKILSCYHENLDFSYENLDRSSWKSQPFIMKISTLDHENLDLLSEKT